MESYKEDVSKIKFGITHCSERCSQLLGYDETMEYDSYCDKFKVELVDDSIDDVWITERAPECIKKYPKGIPAEMLFK